jgi:hypothetical protein
MPKIVHVHIGLFSPETGLAALTETAAVHELVLISAHHVMVGGRFALLRQALAPRRLVALLIADDLPPIERTYIDELLNDGVIPVIVPLGDGPTAALMSWLDSEERSVSGTDHRRAGRRMPGSPPRRRSWGRTRHSNDADEPRRAA